MSKETTRGSGCSASPDSETAVYSHNTSKRTRTMDDLDRRMARIETRLVQLMLHMGLNPYEKTYDTGKPNPSATPDSGKRVSSWWKSLSK